jgi:predicted Zn-dependent protease
MDAKSLREGKTLAQEIGMTQEIARAIAGMAIEEMRAGRMENARTIAEGLLVCNPADAANWLLMAEVHRRGRDHQAARFCAENASKLEPADDELMLALAQLMLASEERDRGLEKLSQIAARDSSAGRRAGKLLQAMG